jgi:hypothetical protein
MSCIVKIKLNDLEKDVPHTGRAVVVYNESKQIFLKQPLTDTTEKLLGAKKFVYARAAFKKGNLTILGAVKPPQPMW